MFLSAEYISLFYRKDTISPLSGFFLYCEGKADKIWLWAVRHLLRLTGAEVVVGAVGVFVEVKTEVIYLYII